MSWKWTGVEGKSVVNYPVNIHAKGLVNLDAIFKGAGWQPVRRTYIDIQAAGILICVKNRGDEVSIKIADNIAKAFRHSEIEFEFNVFPDAVEPVTILIGIKNKI